MTLLVGGTRRLASIRADADRSHVGDRGRRNVAPGAEEVLLVEDNEMSRDMLSRRLIRRGFEMVFAVDGKQGVDAARREKPDIILMDMSLPIMDGWEATRCVKSDDARAACRATAP
jgi:CheY-like chemotaxis protein